MTMVKMHAMQWHGVQLNARHTIKAFAIIYNIYINYYYYIKLIIIIINNKYNRFK